MTGLIRKPKLPHSLAEDHTSTQALITAIESKDRRFRLAQTIFMVGTFIALIVVIGAQQKTLSAVEDQLIQAKNTAAKQSKQSDEASARIERRLDCMVVFFSQKDRTRLSIDNVDKCTLNRDGNLQQFFQQNDNGTTTVKPQATTQPPATAPTNQQSKSPVVQPPVATGGADPNRGVFGWGVCAPVFERLCL